MLITIDLTELKDGLEYLETLISKRVTKGNKKQIVKHVLLSVVSKYFYKEINSIPIELISNTNTNIAGYSEILQFSMYEILDNVFENINFNFNGVSELHIDGVLRGSILILSLEFGKENK